MAVSKELTAPNLDVLPQENDAPPTDNDADSDSENESTNSDTTQPSDGRYFSRSRQPPNWYEQNLWTLAMNRTLIWTLVCLV